jgi:hypothetical protein
VEKTSPFFSSSRPVESRRRDYHRGQAKPVIEVRPVRHCKKRPFGVMRLLRLAMSVPATNCENTSKVSVAAIFAADACLRRLLMADTGIVRWFVTGLTDLNSRTGLAQVQPARFLGSSPNSDRFTVVPPSRKG